jgi:hypothetical protein
VTVRFQSWFHFHDTSFPNTTTHLTDHPCLAYSIGHQGSHGQKPSSCCIHGTGIGLPRSSGHSPTSSACMNLANKHLYQKCPPERYCPMVQSDLPLGAI